jgi:hypothetical protein
MDDNACRRFFAEPEQTFQRRYEALRAFFVEGQPPEAIASQFGYRVGALKSMICRFRTGCGKGQPPPFFFRTDADAPQADGGAKTSTGPNSPRRPTAAE